MTTAPKRQPIPFGKYLLLDRVNIGGMAEVWRAKTFGAGGFERLVAIKRILPNIAEDEEFISMFIDEAKITVQLNHANIAQIYELSHISNSYFIAMEYVSGKDMRAVFDRCRKRGEPAPISLTCFAVAQCGEGLDYAHRAKDKHGRDMNIVHRDVSPQNALISYDGEVKVIDFGIAKAAGKATKTQAGILKGKFGYMSPEQIRGLPLDRRSDVFALGVCLYEMLTGERLFVGDSDFSVLEKVRKVEVLPPSHFNRKIPEQLERIVMKALAKDVDERYQYGNELAEDLRAFMYSTGNVFARKDLAAFMKATFAEDYEKEKNRLQEYADIKAPEGLVATNEPAFGAGVVPAAPSTPMNASNLTSMPTMAPMSSSASQVIAASSGLPPMVRPLPPVPLSNVVSQQTAPRSSVPSIPRLTAVAPMLTNDKEEFNATLLVSGGMAQFEEHSTNPGSDGNEPTRALNLRRPDVATDPGPARVSSPSSAGWQQPQPAAPKIGPPLLARELDDQARLPTKTMAIAPPSSDTNPSLTPVGAPPKAVQPSPRLAAPPSQSASSLDELEPVTSAHEIAEAGNKRLVIVLAGIVALLVVGVVAAVLLKPPATGLVIINVPDDVRNKVTVQINGENVTEKDGSPLKDWPAVRSVKVGKATVRLTAQGYEPLLEIVEVKEDDPAQLSKEMKKSR